MAQRIIDWSTDVLTTSNATPTISTACSLTLSKNWTVAVHARLIITKSDGSTSVGEWHAGFSCPVNATAAANGVVNMYFVDEIGLSSGCFTIPTSGTTIQPRFTGLAATNLTTRMSVKFRIC